MSTCILRSAGPVAGLCVVFATAGQTPVPFRLDTLATSPPTAIISSAAVTDDGGTALITPTANGDVLWKGDATGTPLWAVRLGNTAGMAQVHALPGGAVLVVDPGAVYVGGGGPGIGEDTLRQEIRLISLAANGTVQWSKAAQLEYLVPYEANSTPAEVDCIVNAGGEIHLAVVHPSGVFPSLAWLHVLKFDPNGALQYCKRIGEPAQLPGMGLELISTGFGSPMGLPGMSFTRLGSNGGVVLVTPDPQVAMRIRALALDPSGDPAWYEQIQYLNSGIDLRPNAAVTTSDDNALFVGRLVQTGPLRNITLRIDPQGSVLDADLYLDMQSPLNIGAGDLPGNGALLSDGNGILEVDQDGEIIAAAQFASVTFGDDLFAFQPKTIAPWQGQVLVPTNITSTDQVFGYVTKYGGVWSTDLQQPEPCAIAGMTASHHEVPDSLLSVTPLPLLLSDPVVPVIWNIAPPQATTPLGTVDACTLLMGISPAGLPELAVSVMGNLVPTDQQLLVRTTGPVDLRLLDRTGALVRGTVRSATHGTTELSMHGLAPGLYILEASDPSGMPLGRFKVVVQ